MLNVSGKIRKSRLERLKRRADLAFGLSMVLMGRMVIKTAKQYYKELMQTHN